MQQTSRASEALRRYLDRGEILDLPISFTDRAGKLMADVRYAVERLDKTIRSLEELSFKDLITGLDNRRAARKRLEEDMARIKRGGRSFTLAVLDLDQFKEVNDRWGHQTGDACLKHVAMVIRANVREGDWLARWGGDEFVLLLWEVGGTSSAREVLDRLREALWRSPASLPQGGQVHLTLSGGTCTYRGGEEAASELFARADEALLQAKERSNSFVECE